MNLLRSSLIAILVAMLMPTMPAMAAKEFPDSPLLPGTRVVAGDLSKDEFFIVADNDVMKVKKPIVESVGHGTANPERSIKLAANKPKTRAPNMPIKSLSNQADARKARTLIDVALNKTLMPKAKTPANGASDHNQTSLFRNIAFDKAIASKAPSTQPLAEKANVRKPAEPIQVAFSKVVAQRAPLPMQAAAKQARVEQAAEPIHVAFNKVVAERAPLPIHAERKHVRVNKPDSMQIAFNKAVAQRAPLPINHESKRMKLHKEAEPLQVALSKVISPSASIPSNTRSKQVGAHRAREPKQIAFNRLVAPSAPLAIYPESKQVQIYKESEPRHFAHNKVVSSNVPLSAHTESDRAPVIKAPATKHFAFNKVVAPKVPSTRNIAKAPPAAMELAMNKSKKSNSPTAIKVAFKKAVAHEVAGPNIEGTFKKSIAQNGPTLTDFEFDDEPFPTTHAQLIHPAKQKMPSRAAMKKVQQHQMKPTKVAHHKSVTHSNEKPIKVAFNEVMTPKAKPTIKVALNETVPSKKTVSKLNKALHQMTKHAVNKKPAVPTKTAHKRSHDKSIAKTKAFTPKIISYKPIKPVIKPYAKKGKAKKHEIATQSLMKVHQFVSDKHEANKNMALR